MNKKKQLKIYRKKYKQKKKEQKLLNGFNYVLKINNLYPNKLWKDLKINEINLLIKILNHEDPTTNKNVNT